MTWNKYKNIINAKIKLNQLSKNADKVDYQVLFLNKAIIEMLKEATLIISPRRDIQIILFVCYDFFGGKMFV